MNKSSAACLESVALWACALFAALCIASQVLFVVLGRSTRLSAFIQAHPFLAAACLMALIVAYLVAAYEARTGSITLRLQYARYLRQYVDQKASQGPYKVLAKRAPARSIVQPSVNPAAAPSPVILDTKAQRPAIEGEAARLVEQLANAIRPFCYVRRRNGVVDIVLHVQIKAPIVTINSILIPVRLKQGARISALAAIKKDICLRMPPGTEFQEQISGGIFCGFCVPKQKKTLPLYADVAPTIERNPGKPRFVVGIDDRGTLHMGDIWGCHTLFAGETNSGKSCALNAALVSLFETCSPKRLIAVLVDPKLGAELGVYEGDKAPCGIQHLLCPVVKDVKHAPKVFAWIESEMNKRYQRLASANCKDIVLYNARHADDPMPFLLLVIDEYADCRNNAGKPQRLEIDRSITALVSKGRAAGVHVMIATQRPGKNVFTEALRDQLKQKLMLAMPSASAQTIMQHDTPDTSQLKGRGDLFYISPAGECTRAQSVFVDDHAPQHYTELQRRIDQCIQYWHAQGHENSYNGALVRAAGMLMRGDHIATPAYDHTHAHTHAHNGDTNGGMSAASSKDALYNDVVKYAVDNARISRDMILKEFRIGAERANSILRAMEIDGIIAQQEYKTESRRILVNDYE